MAAESKDFEGLKAQVDAAKDREHELAKVAVEMCMEAKGFTNSVEAEAWIMQWYKDQGYEVLTLSDEPVVVACNAYARHILEQGERPPSKS